MTSGPNLPPLSEDARRALEAFRTASPGSRRREANRDAVQERVREGAPIPAAAAGLAWPIGWGVASAAAAAGLIWGIVEIRSPASSEPPVPAPSEAAATAASATPSRAPAAVPAQPDLAKPNPVQPEAPAPVPERAVRASAVPPATAASSLAQETRMLRAARAEIAAGAFDRAAEALDVYTARFPDGALREDAQAYRVVVKCGRGDDGAALRRAFERRYPVSPHIARIQAACDQKKE